jgi:hypothetical protein
MLQLPEGTVHTCEQYPWSTWASCWANSPKGIYAAPWQILDVHFFRLLPLTRDEFGPQTSAIASVMKFCLQPNKERPKPTSYVTWSSFLVRTGPGLRTGLELEFIWASTLGTRTRLTLNLLLDLGNLAGLDLLQSMHHAWT